MEIIYIFMCLIRPNFNIHGKIKKTGTTHSGFLVLDRVFVNIFMRIYNEVIFNLLSFCFFLFLPPYSLFYSILIRNDISRGIFLYKNTLF